jgi:hypothetical protein
MEQTVQKLLQDVQNQLSDLKSEKKFRRSVEETTRIRTLQKN